MSNDRLSHSSFHPKYYTKVGKYPNVRYFYSPGEYRRYLEMLKTRKGKRQLLREDQERLYKQGLIDRGNRDRTKGATDARAAYLAEQRQRYDERKKQEEEDKQRQEEDKQRKEEERKRQQQRDKAFAEANARFLKSRELPDEVSLSDYVFGGKYRKELKSAKKNLKAIGKELEKQKNKLKDLDEKIEKLSGDPGKLSAKQKIKLKNLTDQRAELEASVKETRKEYVNCKGEYSNALYRYEGATLLGQVKKKLRLGTGKAKRIIKKYSNMALSKIPTVKLNQKG